MWTPSLPSELQLKKEFVSGKGHGKINVASRDSFPSFPSHYIPCRPHLTAMFVRDSQDNKPHMMRGELRAIVSNHSLAVDHQCKVVKRTVGGDVTGSGGQTFTICVDYGLVCGVVPDTSLSWTENAMSEVIDRHKSIGIEIPYLLYMDCGSCGGTINSTSSKSPTSVGGKWRSMVNVKLDAMHMMLCIGREINAELPRRKRFLIDLQTLRLFP